MLLLLKSKPEYVFVHEGKAGGKDIVLQVEGHTQSPPGPFVSCLRAQPYIHDWTLEEFISEKCMAFQYFYIKWGSEIMSFSDMLEFFREIELIGHTYTWDLFIIYNKLIHVSMVSRKSKMCVDWQAADPGELMVQMKPQGSMLENSIMLRETGFCSIQVSNWLNETHSHYGRQSALPKVHPFKC